MPSSSVLEVPYQLALVIFLAVAPATGEPVPHPLPPAPAAARLQPAEGPYRFSEQAWMRALMQDGAARGQGVRAARIFMTTSGRCYVPDAAERDRILALRSNAHLAGQLAGDQAKRHAAEMTARLKRPVQPAEVFIAHHFGAATAARLVDLLRGRPLAAAAPLLEEAAAEPQELFFDGVRERSVAEVYQSMTSAFARRLMRRPPGSGLSGNPETRGSLAVGVGEGEARLPAKQVRRPSAARAPGTVVLDWTARIESREPSRF